MLAPKRVKFRKRFKGRTKGMATRGNTLVFGHYALMVLEPGWITNRQIEAGRVALTREMKRGGKMWPRLFPDKPVTKKPAETRMGKGKGNPEGWVAVVKPGRIIFEVEGVSEEVARTARALAAAKVRTGVVVSDKMTKTVTVSLVRRFAHGFYGKQVVRTKQVAAHNDKGAKAGDTVRIVETRPLSRTKRWRVVEVLERAR